MIGNIEYQYLFEQHSVHIIYFCFILNYYLKWRPVLIFADVLICNLWATKQAIANFNIQDFGMSNFATSLFYNQQNSSYLAMTIHLKKYQFSTLAIHQCNKYTLGFLIRYIYYLISLNFYGVWARLCLILK
jgi:hypothetical protein